MSFIRVSEYAALLLFILYLQCHHTKGENYHIRKPGSTWNSASHDCTLMGSERAPSYVVNVQVSYPADMEEDSPHWIGATSETTPWFNFSGCYVYEAIPEEEIKKLDTRSAFIGPVADCYLQCKSHFGVNETHCFCILDLEKGRLNGTCELITSISFENDVIGYTHGNIDKKYHLAMYIIFNGTLKIKDNLDECLVTTDTGFMAYPCDSIGTSSG
uniref:Apple domain-containing protein n=1 Tax=Magallana gigas TaxID=29159 RepID=A0A8W8MNE4_MAGGI|nr:uncharacterized protein LOC105323158 [Crassostrea gigas]